MIDADNIFPVLINCRTIFKYYG